jgi:hypothetical protein
MEAEAEAEAEIMNQELHIHHHYHGPKITKNLPKVQASRRPKKKRFSLTPTHFDPPPQLDRSSTAAILNQTSVSVPNSHRWSQAITLTIGSVPNSPVSDSHRGSMYDPIFSDIAYDSSRPTSSPDSVDQQSPMFGPTRSNDYHLDPDRTPRHQRWKSHGLKVPGLSNMRSASTPISMLTKSSPATAVISAVSPANSFVSDMFTLSPHLPPAPQAAIPEEVEKSSLSTPEPSFVISPNRLGPGDLLSPPMQTRPSMRRHASHESLISVSGMDIHTLQSRLAQLYSSSPRFSTPRGAASIDPEVTSWTATAHGTLSRRPMDSSSMLHSSIANQQRRVRKRDGPPSSGIGKNVGGWVFGKWGATPASPLSPQSTRPLSSNSQQSKSSQGTQDTAKKKDKAHERPVPKLRPSGVNQNGPIWGFFDMPEVESRVVVKNYDAEALGEALTEDRG